MDVNFLGPVLQEKLYGWNVLTPDSLEQAMILAAAMARKECKRE